VSKLINPTGNSESSSNPGKKGSNLSVQSEKIAESRAKRATELAEHLELAIEEVMEGYPDCGISVETDYRGYTTTLTVRIHKNKAGGILRRNTYLRKKEV
jgi:hypothetical protein